MDRIPPLTHHAQVEAARAFLVSLRERGKLPFRYRAARLVAVAPSPTRLGYHPVADELRTLQERAVPRHHSNPAWEHHLVEVTETFLQSASLLVSLSTDPCLLAFARRFDLNQVFPEVRLDDATITRGVAFLRYLGVSYPMPKSIVWRPSDEWPGVALGERWNDAESGATITPINMETGAALPTPEPTGRRHLLLLVEGCLALYGGHRYSHDGPYAKAGTTAPLRNIGSRPLIALLVAEKTPDPNPNPSATLPVPNR